MAASAQADTSTSVNMLEYIQSPFEFNKFMSEKVDGFLR